MSCNCSPFLIALNSTTKKAVWPTIGVTMFKIIPHQKRVFRRIHPIRNKPWKSSKPWSGLIMRQEFLWSWMWSTIISTRPSMVLSKIQYPIIITGWSQMVASKMGQVSVMKQLVSMKCTASTWLIPSRTGSKSTRSMASALIWWGFTM